MSIFKKYAVAAQEMRAEVTGDPVIDQPPVIDPNDPLVGTPQDDEFAEQRARRNREQGMEAVDLATPVDGTDDDMTVGAGDTDVKLPEGEHGEDADKTVSGNDVTVDADNTEATFTSEADDFDDVLIPPVDDDLDSIEDDAEDIEMLSNEMRMMMDASSAIEQFGMNPTTLGVLQATNLLAGTSLDTLALESVQFSDGQHPESQMALEALGEKIKQKAQMWADKILHVASSASEKIMSVLKPIWDKISGFTARLSAKAWDATKSAGATIKAHPYKSVAAALLAAGAVAAIVAFAVSGTPAPGAKLDVMKAFMKDLVGKINKIKLPTGKVTATLNEAGTKIALKMEGGFGVAKEAAISSLGWTQNSVKALSGQADKVYKATKDAWSALGAKTVKIASSFGKGVVDGVSSVVKMYHPANIVKDGAKLGGFVGDGVIRGSVKVTGNANFSAGLGIVTGLSVAGAYIIAMFANLINLTKLIVIGAFRMVAAAFSALTGHYGEPATA